MSIMYKTLSSKTNKQHAAERANINDMLLTRLKWIYHRDGCSTEALMTNPTVGQSDLSQTLKNVSAAGGGRTDEITQPVVLLG